MLKKILPYGTVALSALLLVMAVIDLLVGSVDLFAMLFFRLAVTAMILLPFGLTALICLKGELRRPLMLTACLLQSPFGGAMAILLVYDLCFPEQFDLNFLLPLAVLLVAFASVIHGVVVLLCMSMESEAAETESETEPVGDATASTDSPLTEETAPDSSAQPSAPVQAPESENPPTAFPGITPVAVPKKHSTAKGKASGQEVVAAKMASRPRKTPVSLMDDELAPVPKKKHREEAPAPKRAEEPTPQKLPVYTDLFELLSEEVEHNRKTASEAPAVEEAVAQEPVRTEKTAQEAPAAPVWVKELPDEVFALPSIQREEEPAMNLNLSFAPKTAPDPSQGDPKGQ